MTINHRRLVMVCGTIGILIVATLTNANLAGLRFNSTAAVTREFWQVVEHDAPLRRGEVVAICPPNTKSVRQGAERGYIPAGNCPDGYEPLVKPVAATAGDIVAVSPAGISVNGQSLPDTAQLAQDSAGRPLRAFPAGVYHVAAGEVWLVAKQDTRSFDSRYFGSVPIINARGGAHPVWAVR